MPRGMISPLRAAEMTIAMGTAPRRQTRWGLHEAGAVVPLEGEGAEGEPMVTEG